MIRERNWTVEVHLCEIFSGQKQILEQGGEDTEMVLKLAQVPARFIYNGVRYFGEKPTVDPIARKIIYYCEGYRDA